MRQSKKATNVVGSAGNVAPVKPKAPAAGFSTPSVKIVLDYFHSRPEIQVMYAERCMTVFRDFCEKKIRLYPAHLNTNSDIVDFIYSIRDRKVTNGDSLAEDFLAMSICPTPAEAVLKRKREKKETADVLKSVKVPPVKREALPERVVPVKEVSRAPKRPAVVAGSGKWSLVNRERKQLAFDLTTLPNWMAFFPNPRVAIYSSKGGLHDVSCGICAEVGYYNAVDAAGVHRRMNLGQRAWIATLHDLMGPEGLILKGRSDELLAVRSYVDQSVSSIMDCDDDQEVLGAVGGSGVGEHLGARSKGAKP